MKKDELDRRLNKLLSEEVELALDREQGQLEQMIGKLDQDFILFGAGNLGRRALRVLQHLGHTPRAFIDNNPDLWGKDLLGIPIMSPAEAATKFDPAKTGVITTIWCGEATDKMSDRLAPLKKLGFEKLALFGHLAWKFHEEFLPHYCLDRPSKLAPQAAQIHAAYALLADDESRQIFVDHIEWRLFLDYDLLPYPTPEVIYFNEKFINISDSEVLYDIGAYTGDSLESFLNSKRGKAFREIHSFEPSQSNFSALQEYIGRLESIHNKVFAHKLALGDSSGSIQVEGEHGPASRVGIGIGIGSETVPMTTIDIFCQSATPPTFIKIDIEGFEPQCLLGARQVITDTAPVVAVCVYHLQSHLWEILLQLHSYNPNYRFQLGPHVADGWDLVLYAVPRHRQPN